MESGLKHRNVALNANKDNQMNRLSDDFTNTDKETSYKNDTDDNEELDNDSKETRLTLMEEVLLLGLKDREVYI